MQESTIKIQLVHGGFILTTPSDELEQFGVSGGSHGARTEVFPTQAKLIKALRAAIEKYSLVTKAKAEATDADAE